MTLTLDSPKLRELTRTQLQSLAKREVVRAVGKTEDIIRRLIQKHPTGVPVNKDTENPSTSPERNQIRESHKGTPSLTHLSDPSVGHAYPQVVLPAEGEPAANGASSSPSSSTEALEQIQQLLSPDDEPAAYPSNPSPNPGLQVDEEEHANAYDDEYGYTTGAPTHYMVVDALRQFTTLVNTIPFMEARVAESRCLLQRTETLLEKATPEARELTVTREYLETFLLGKMKQKRELWDGTGKMNKQDRKLRMAWLRAERKAESEKRWKAANELNAKHGLDPEPFSAFALESDEEVIESLLTTPASSRSGSSKRSREESVDVFSAEYVHDASPRKKARS